MSYAGMTHRDSFKDGREQGWRDKERECEKLREEIERLQDAKRRALAIADERSKENVELRAEIERLRARIIDLYQAGDDDEIWERAVKTIDGKT